MQRTDPVNLIPASISFQQQAALLNRQALTWLERDLPLAISLLEKAIHLCEPAGPEQQDDLLQLALALLHLGRCRLRLDQNDQALENFSRARELFSSRHETNRAISCTSGIGLAHLRLGNTTQAFTCLYQSLEQAQDLGGPLLIAVVQRDLGCAFACLDQPEQALPYLLESAASLRRLDERLELSAALDGLCQAYRQHGQNSRALECGLESVRLAECLEAWLRLAEYLRSLGQVYQAQGEADLALECYRRSLNLAQKYGASQAGVGAAGALQAIGEIHRGQGRLDLALVSLQDALVTAEQAGAKPLQMECCQGLVEVFKQSRDFEAALAYQERLQALKEARFDEEASRRVQNLEATHQLEVARRQAEAMQRKTDALQKEIDEHKRLEAQLEHLANTDPLTGIINRRKFYNLAVDKLERSRRLRLPLSLIMFDLDHFKVINDTYGHMAGDDVLVEIARRVSADVRQADILARFGGEEFVVLLPETSHPLAQIIAERLRQRVGSTPFRIDVATLSITISLGVAHYTGQEELALEKLLDFADRALYQAKESGRNKVVCYTKP